MQLIIKRYHRIPKVLSTFQNLNCKVSGFAAVQVVVAWKQYHLSSASTQILLVHPEKVEAVNIGMVRTAKRFWFVWTRTSLKVLYERERTNERERERTHGVTWRHISNIFRRFDNHFDEDFRGNIGLRFSGLR